MNIRQIEFFSAVMETGSVSDAARLLHVSVPSVSRVLAHTEMSIGFPLFERVKGRLHPTQEARKLYHEVEFVYQGVQRITDLTHELSDRRSCLITVAATPSIGQSLMPMAIGQFKDGNPDVRVHFQDLSHGQLKEQLLNRRSELGLSILPIEHPNLISVPLAVSRVVCICPRRHALASRESITAQDLSDIPLITYPSETPFGARLKAFFSAYDLQSRSSIEVTSPQNACALVDVGAGVALVDEFSLESWQDSRFKVLPVDDAPSVVASLVYLRNDPLSPVAEAFVRSLRSVLMQRGFALLEGTSV